MLDREICTKCLAKQGIVIDEKYDSFWEYGDYYTIEMEPNLVTGMWYCLNGNTPIHQHGYANFHCPFALEHLMKEQT